MSASAGISDRSAYRAVAALERRALARSLLHGTELLRTTRRYQLTAAGLQRLAAIEGEPPDALLRARPHPRSGGASCWSASTPSP